ncbi:class I SAM-dependent methyltransferase, partial [Candidatus Pacearchaeota archaeon]|nr:class I SAM-dependent methyltransferase [Candidatus Pacearchaeota archaeon]
KMENEKRFKGAIGTEYALFEKAYPHFKELQERIALEICKYAKDRNLSVLEIGCGPGPTSDKILSSNENINLTAVDNEGIMISQAKEYLSNYGDRVKLVEDDALSFLRGVSDASFDAVASAWTIHNFTLEYRENIIKEIFRVLKPSGLFVNGDKYAQENINKHHEDFNWSIEQFIEKMAKTGNSKICYEWIIHMGLDESSNLLMKEKDSLSQLENLGFLNPRIIWRERMEAILITQKGDEI